MLFVALDMGSSYIKSVLFDLEEGCIIEKSKMPMIDKIDNDDKNIFEIDANNLFQVIKNIIDDFLLRYNNIDGVLFSTQMHGFVYSSEDNEKDIYVSWQDTRCLNVMQGSNVSYLEYLKEHISIGEMEKTGVYLKPGLALCNLFTLLDQNSELRNYITIYTLGSYIISKLTGNNICHITNAAALGLANIFTGNWETDILNKLELKNINLPQISRKYEDCGTYTFNGKSIKVYPDIGDMQTAVLGCSASCNDMVINIGTAGQVILLDHIIRKGNIEIRPYFENIFCNVISRMPSGRNLDVQIDYLREAGEKIFGISMKREDVWNKILNNLSSMDSQGLAVKSEFYELPDRLADGAIIHINRLNFTIDNVIIATLIDIGKIYKKYMELLYGPDGLKGNLYFCGGAALNNPMLVSTIEKEAALGKKAAYVKNEIYIGMFRLALLFTKKCKSMEETIRKELKINE
jgi:hypothetical protein